MAKRVSPEEKTWNPVEDRLAQETLMPSLAVETAPAQGPTIPPSPAPAANRVVRISDHRETAHQVEQKADDQAPRKTEVEPVEKLSREKRMLLTESEEDMLERLVKDMGKQLKTPLKLSHILRATTVLLMHSRDELLKQSEKMGGMKRPPNNDPAGLATFEHNLARLIDRAIRGTRVFE
jgi:hypothetical protein